MPRVMDIPETDNKQTQKAHKTERIVPPSLKGDVIESKWIANSDGVVKRGLVERCH